MGFENSQSCGTIYSQSEDLSDSNFSICANISVEKTGSEKNLCWHANNIVGRTFAVCSEEWVGHRQIASFFSRLASAVRSGKELPTEDTQAHDEETNQSDTEIEMEDDPLFPTQFELDRDMIEKEFGTSLEQNEQQLEQRQNLWSAFCLRIQNKHRFVSEMFIFAGFLFLSHLDKNYKNLFYTWRHNHLDSSSYVFSP